MAGDGVREQVLVACFTASRQVLLDLLAVRPVSERWNVEDLVGECARRRFSSRFTSLRSSVSLQDQRGLPEAAAFISAALEASLFDVLDFELAAVLAQLLHARRPCAR
jgi:hypothetical protein